MLQISFSISFKEVYKLLHLQALVLLEVDTMLVQRLKDSKPWGNKFPFVTTMLCVGGESRGLPSSSNWGVIERTISCAKRAQRKCSTKTSSEASNHTSQCKAKTQWSPLVNKWAEVLIHEMEVRRNTVTQGKTNHNRKHTQSFLENWGSNTKNLECHANLQNKKCSHVGTIFLP